MQLAVNLMKAMRVKKHMFGNQTRKSILYLDQNFFSSAQRGEWATAPVARITELLDLQLLAIPYSSTHIDEADLNGEYRDELVRFIQRLSRSHHFEPYWRVGETQIVKAFQAFLENRPEAYQKDERDALPPSVHDWDGDYSINVFGAASGVDRKSMYKQEAFDELLKALPQWANKARTFKDDMELEIGDSARVLVDSYSKKSTRLLMGDFSALIDAPIDASVVESMIYIVKVKKANLDTIGAFFNSKHFANVPAVQLSARLFSAYKQSLRSSKTTPDPKSKKTRDKLSGFFYDIQHAASYAPYCEGYFTDAAMAKLMNDEAVRIEEDFGCKVFSVDKMPEFFAWLDGLKSRMTPEHAEDLSWAYPELFPFHKI